MELKLSVGNNKTFLLVWCHSHLSIYCFRLISLLPLPLLALELSSHTRLRKCLPASSKRDDYIEMINESNSKECTIFAIVSK